jgi:hypothetical protein
MSGVARDELEGTAGMAEAPAGTGARAGLGALRVVLGLQIALGLLWGISMLFFAPVIVLGEPSGAHIEKIAIEGGAHLMLVVAAVLVWRAPRRSGDVLRLMIVLNGLWALTDLVYIPLLGLSEVDFYAKAAVNAGLAIGLAVTGRRAHLV